MCAFVTQKTCSKSEYGATVEDRRSSPATAGPPASDWSECASGLRSSAASSGPKTGGGYEVVATLPIELPGQ
jgi:hypothetical protein